MRALRWGWLLLWLLAGACQVRPTQEGSTATAAPVRPAATPTTQPASPSPTPLPQANIIVTAPTAGSAVAGSLHVAGRARVFEGALVVVLYDGQSRELARVPVQASAGAPEWGTFQRDLTFLTPQQPGPGRVEVVSYSPRDGSVLDRAAVPVVLLARTTGGALPTATVSSPQR